MTRAVWPAYRTVRDLLHAHAGERAIVMGGGATLPEAIEACGMDGVLISANEHGARLLAERGELQRLAYIVALDKIETRLRPFGVPLVSRHMWADYRILDIPCKFSGMAAAWVARLMGCDPIILCGMDCYEGGTYWHNPTAKSSSRHMPTKVHFSRWRAFAREAPANYQCGAGILHKLFPPAGGAPSGTAPPREQIALESAGTFVQLNESMEITGRPFAIGTILELKRIEASRLIERRKARGAAMPV